ncbi:hypothetical protein [Pseudoalteromonas sp.]|uniref:hypothetical protein n=1 Tax=Pseudoalteromonas sp. TaxID=53249 RepID=UPI0035157460
MKFQEAEAKVYCFPEFADEIAAIELKFQYLSYVISVLEDSDEIELAKYSDLSVLNESDAVFILCIYRRMYKSNTEPHFQSNS